MLSLLVYTVLLLIVMPALLLGMAKGVNIATARLTNVSSLPRQEDETAIPDHVVESESVQRI